MNARQKISIVLVLIGLILVFLPGIGQYSFKEKPKALLNSVLEDDACLSVDQVAVLLNNDDPSTQLIDLRNKEEFEQFSIPGAINIPIKQFFKRKPEIWLYNTAARYVFYGNGDLYSGYALVMAQGLGYKNCWIMKGGLNAWFDVVMNSQFSGDYLSPRENARFENRTKAKQFFIEINSLPDSLKLKYAESKRQAERSLDGGCN